MWVKWTFTLILMHIHILTKVRDQKRGDWAKLMGHTFMHKCTKGVEHTWGGRWTCLHVLMHICII